MIDIHTPTAEQPSLEDYRSALASELEREVNEAPPPVEEPEVDVPEIVELESGKRLSEAMV